MKNKQEYLEKLKDPRWQRKRLEILERDKWACRACGDKDGTLHVHHIFYQPKKEPWEIQNGFLITFCEHCHKGICRSGSCDKCENYKSGDEYECGGPGNHKDELINLIGVLLGLIWSDEGYLGREDYQSKLTNLIYQLKG